jgi:predicted TIM-barrel fold metal-dependent hydrolase
VLSANHFLRFRKALSDHPVQGKQHSRQALPLTPLADSLTVHRAFATQVEPMLQSPIAFELRPDWLALHVETALDPSQLVIDSHHHLYHRPGLRYLLEEYLADLDCGHNVRATVAVQARAMLRAEGPLDLASLGETEFLNGQAAMSASGIYGTARVSAAIVGHVDLTLGDRLRPVLERHMAASARLQGVRQPLAWDADTTLLNPAYGTTEGLADNAAFRQGLSVLQDLGLAFEIWAFYPQLPRLARLAAAFPDLTFVVNHLGGVIRAGAHAERDIYPLWRQGLAALADCPNVLVKLSGLGMRLSGLGFDERAQPPSSEDLAAVWRPWMMTALELFGPSRCMWGSNFPVDKGSYSYGIGLNAIKRLLTDATPDDRQDVLWRTAARHYNINL